ncbi:MAG: hypothetical protein JNM94_10970, partial [Phycisphaerae bacterium]|nr:hypothetical protein [Phycisphaerae bacterium]
YTTHLDLRVAMVHPPEKPAFAILDAVDPATDAPVASIMFATGLWQGTPALTGHIHFDLGPHGHGPSRVLPLVERLRGACEILWGPEVYPYGRRECSLRDPNGYAIVLSEETSDPVTDPD